MTALGEFFHRVVDMLPWRDETAKMDAHTEVEDVVLPAFGRNTVSAGLQTGEDSSPTTVDTSTPGGFPANPTTSE